MFGGVIPLNLHPHKINFIVEIVHIPFPIKSHSDLKQYQFTFEDDVHLECLYNHSNKYVSVYPNTQKHIPTWHLYLFYYFFF